MCLSQGTSNLPSKCNSLLGGCGSNEALEDMVETQTKTKLVFQWDKIVLSMLNNIHIIVHYKPMSGKASFSRRRLKWLPRSLQWIYLKTILIVYAEK